MKRKILSRLLSGLVVAWGSISVVFLGLHALPGRIEDILAGDLDYPGLKEAIAAEWGLDRPLWTQYLNYLGRIAEGDFGISYELRQPVFSIIGEQLLPTVALASTAGLIAFVFAVLMASFTAGNRGIARKGASLIELIFASTPVFWVGILLLMAFSFSLQWFPVSGAESWNSLVLPAITLALPTAGLLAQVLRESMEKTLEQPFVTTIRARGLDEYRIRIRHILRHAILPMATLGGWLIGGLLGGAVITEKVFGRPGIGTVTLNAVLSHDIPLVMAVVLLAAFIHVTASTLLDILYVIVDPRLRAQ